MTKTAFIAIVGRPNVGKSTLLNAMVGEKVAIVSKKPQTTRNRITGVLTRGEEQFVFLDTPGIHRPRTKLGDFMVKTAGSSIGDSDGVLLVVEPRGSVGDIESEIMEKIKQAKLPAILVINKTDSASASDIALTITAYTEQFDFTAVVPTSAKSSDNVDAVLDECGAFMSPGPWFFPEDSFTDQPERQIASEIIREKLLRTLDKEIPHGTAVTIEEFREEKGVLHIRAEIFCEKDSHKGIIIGKNGKMLKLIGTYAREDLEKFFGIKVFIDLWVKVKENWRDSSFNLNNFGFTEQ
jgi:GTP-binding protein Era